MDRCKLNLTFAFHCCGNCEKEKRSRLNHLGMISWARWIYFCRLWSLLLPRDAPCLQHSWTTRKRKWSIHAQDLKNTKTCTAVWSSSGPCRQPHVVSWSHRIFYFGLAPNAVKPKKTVFFWDCGEQKLCTMSWFSDHDSTKYRHDLSCYWNVRSLISFLLVRPRARQTFCGWQFFLSPQHSNKLLRFLHHWRQKNWCAFPGSWLRFSNE